MSGAQFSYGGVPVPYTVAWTAEERHFVAQCAYFNRPALCMDIAPVSGKPKFGTPHSQRQREAVARGLCDLCGKPLAIATKVSLSHASVRLDGALGPCVMQVEPLLHRRCAAVSLRHCPSLKRDVRNGTLHIRQVGRFRAQAALMSIQYVQEMTGLAQEALGHAKVELMAWQDRDEAWLMQERPA